MPGDTGRNIMKTAPQTLPEALAVIRAMHHELLAFRYPEFDLIKEGREGEFDDRVKAVLAHSAPVIKLARQEVESGLLALGLPANAAESFGTMVAECDLRGKSSPESDLALFGYGG